MDDVLSGTHKSLGPLSEGLHLHPGPLQLPQACIGSGCDVAYHRVLNLATVLMCSILCLAYDTVGSQMLNLGADCAFATPCG